MARRRGGGGDVLPFTLTEVFVLLFFVLALFLGMSLRERDGPTVKAENDSLCVKIEGQVRAFNIPGLDSLSCIQMFGPLDSMFTTLTDAKQEKDSLCVQIEDHARALGITVPDELSCIEKTKAIGKGIGDMRGGDGPGVECLGPKCETVAGLIDRLKYRGHLPCWQRDTESQQTEIVYALRVVLSADEIAIRREWPDDFADSARVVDGLVSLSQAGTVSYPDFTTRAAPVFEWSRQHDPECRHYVIIHDSVQGSNAKDDFKTGLLTVEDYFYKNLVRDPS
jgi:hypothetical protein